MSKGGVTSSELSVSGPLCLLVTAPDGKQAIAVLAPGTRYSIGSSRAADIRVDDPLVSEQHAVILGGPAPVLVDVGSEHGTWVGEERLRPHVHHVLTIDAVVTIGRTVARFARSQPSGTHRIDLSPYETSASEPPPSEGGTLTESPPSGKPSRAMRQLNALADLVAASSVSVLILGETGVGKEVMARTIHDRSPRRGRPLVSLNCAAIPENLLESELYGHERGAFSGAVSAKPGTFETADGSTLFLDEVGDLPLSSQAKLLRVLDTGEVQRIGAVRPTRVDVRVISATNRDLQSLIVQGRFRSDLYYRLNGMTIAIPPLRERREDIVHLSATFARELSQGEPPRFTPRALERLRAHPWHGNVRELRTVVHRALLLARGGEIDVGHLVLDVPPPATTAQPERSELGGFDAAESPTAAVAARLQSELDERERRKIREALERCGGSQKGAAELLGISRRTLINRLERLEMPRPRKYTDAPGRSTGRRSGRASAPPQGASRRRR